MLLIVPCSFITRREHASCACSVCAASRLDTQMSNIKMLNIKMSKIKVSNIKKSNLKMSKSQILVPKSCFQNVTFSWHFRYISFHFVTVSLQTFHFLLQNLHSKHDIFVTFRYISFHFVTFSLLTFRFLHKYTTCNSIYNCKKDTPYFIFRCILFYYVVVHWVFIMVWFAQAVFTVHSPCPKINHIWDVMSKT